MEHVYATASLWLGLAVFSAIISYHCTEQPARVDYLPRKTFPFFYGDLQTFLSLSGGLGSMGLTPMMGKNLFSP